MKKLTIASFMMLSLMKLSASDIFVEAEGFRTGRESRAQTGGRESRRLLGDYILREEDLLNTAEYEDATPRDVYQHCLPELRELMKAGVTPASVRP